MPDGHQEHEGLDITVLGSESYQIPTTPCEASLVFVGGKREAVTLFLATHSALHPGSETLDEFLNSDRLFLPVQSLEERRSFLVNRAAILCLEVGPDAPMLDWQKEGNTSLDIITVVLEGGEVVVGALRLDAPAENQRISDLFNGKETFLPVEGGEQVTFFNKRRVVRVDF